MIIDNHRKICGKKGKNSSQPIKWFKAMTIFCGIDNIMRSILHIQFECEEYSAKYCQSRKTLLWLWIMLSLLWCINNVIIVAPYYVSSTIHCIQMYNISAQNIKKFVYVGVWVYSSGYSLLNMIFSKKCDADIWKFYALKFHFWNYWDST
jgi:hypothetical protein